MSDIDCDVVCNPRWNTLLLHRRRNRLLKQRKAFIILSEIVAFLSLIAQLQNFAYFPVILFEHFVAYAIDNSLIKGLLKNYDL